MTANFLTFAASARAGEDDEKLRHREAPRLFERPRAAADVAILCMVVNMNVYRALVGQSQWQKVENHKPKSIV